MRSAKKYPRRQETKVSAGSSSSLELKEQPLLPLVAFTEYLQDIHIQLFMDISGNSLFELLGWTNLRRLVLEMPAGTEIWIGELAKGKALQGQFP